MKELRDKLEDSRVEEFKKKGVKYYGNQISKMFRASYYTCICLGIDDRRNHRGRTEITRDVESR